MITLNKDLTDKDTFNAATSQEVFDFVAHHLLTQNETSLLELGTDSCAYHGKNGLKCAAGCLIPDNLYLESFEGQTWRYVLKELGFTSHDKLVSSLQDIHDSRDIDFWFEKLESLAKVHCLSTNVLEQFE